VILEGSREIAAPLDVVWDFVTDLNRVTKCIPDTTVEKIEGDSFKAKMKMGVGFIRGTFDGQFSLVDKNPKSSFSIKGTTKGMGNTVNVTINITLEPSGSNVSLRYKADVIVSGTLASMGARFMDDAAQKIVNQMFDCLKASISAK
jgi:carbon monoxide dehydrogenase subunit G